jgi:hypothetical protein
MGKRPMGLRAWLRVLIRIEEYLLEKQGTCGGLQPPNTHRML